MEAVTGVFQTRETAERALSDVRNAGIAEGKVTLLTPGTVDHVEKEVREIPTDTAEQPGMANAMGALLGGGVGLTGGSVLMALTSHHRNYCDLASTVVLTHLYDIGIRIIGGLRATAVATRGERCL